MWDAVGKHALTGFGAGAGKAAVDHAVTQVFGGRAVAVRPAREVAKSQRIRALDVAILGPATIAAGVYASRPLPQWARLGLIGYGIATIAYNARNWVATERSNRG